MEAATSEATSFDFDHKCCLYYLDVLDRQHLFTQLPRSVERPWCGADFDIASPPPRGAGSSA